MPMENYPKYAEGYIQPATEYDEAMDNLGVTNPNLHRRTDITLTQQQIDAGETAPRQYNIGVFNLCSYRTTRINYHDEESTTSEVP